MKKDVVTINEVLTKQVSDILGTLSLIDVMFIVVVSEIGNMVLARLFPNLNQDSLLVRYIPGIILGIIIDFYYRETLNQSANISMIFWGMLLLIVLANKFKKYI